MKKIYATQFGQDVTWLYVVHFANYVVPLLLIPYLARVLGADGWGTVMFALAFANFANTIIEYGFYVSAQRKAARFRDEPALLLDLFNEVLSAKLLMVFVVVLLGFAVSKLIPILNSDLKLVAGTLAFGAIQGLNLTWYFRGLQRIRIAAFMELVGRGLGAALIVFLLREKDDAWKYFLGLAIAQSAVLMWGLLVVSKEIGLRVPNISAAVNGIREGRDFFLLHVVGSIFTSSSVFILGLLVAPKEVGYFAAAEKLARVLAGVVEPIRNALFPRFSYLVFNDRQAAKQQIRKIAFSLMGFSVSLAALAYMSSSLLVLALFGNDFVPAIQCFRILLLLLPILTLNAVLSHLWMLPRGLERKCIVAVTGGMLVNILLASLLVPQWQQVGMAMSVAIAELCVVIGFSLALLTDKD